ncbi:benzoyl-CoA reductase/2-hydroxyglutaryl-CoA dehydratase subunit BcrC/BadD/HgdB [Nonomuraea thailandensis]|uniref:Benzoyl-CoA reductase/2-hydroxyglutaryl-CoA dehydratase subunit BcrC/BadD/HgdB n=1 Tax=Nonomuraea thailandensis TaxID=1188745 RepID=A0A9X2GDI3_9ACTN|nr:2-hydroxyacyl-CoA dehydratase family protein [Nonomuraea thailandensis]MCP2355785.1 benzoyl-CoA reductase/2-hydroxyglutaryl-CoA dehydratase subunit BcrC/BadD/HgdB [Nonomuraea thailandensis]
MAGYVGADVPVELLTAAGFHAVRLTGDPGGDSALGDRYLGRGVDPMARSILTRLLTGAFGELERVVVSHDCEASLRLFYALRELRRIEPGAGVPEAYLVDVLHLPHRTTARYNRRRIGEFAARLRAWTGRPVDPAAAIGAHDERRRLLAAVAGLRRAVPARLTGAEFLAAANAALPLAEHLARLRELLAQSDRLPERHGRRVFLSGSDHDTPDVYEAIEADGHVIVGEDHSFGDLQAERRVGAGGLDALAEHYHEHGPTAHRATAAQRAAHAAMAVRRCRAELFVAYARTGDDAPAWDFAAQRAALDIPAVLLDRQEYGRADLAALRKEDA